MNAILTEYNEDKLDDEKLQAYLMDLEENEEKVKMIVLKLKSFKEEKKTAEAKKAEQQKKVAAKKQEPKPEKEKSENKNAENKPEGGHKNKIFDRIEPAVEKGPSKKVKKE